jgi:uncharacterized protein
MKNTLIIGASTNPNRISYKLAIRLLEKNYTVYAIGGREGKIHDLVIHSELIALRDVHTITMYINPTLQLAYLDYILSLEPKRVIFNPGAENPEVYPALKAGGIEVLEACNLVMLISDTF